ncbi:MAG TPA: sigma-70 family RNA polymerase sigma factor [Thermoclostridium sp.]|nr:sigma-70 family RNA polymerase sigma factor [Thermoclostridium sp.]
MEDNRIVDLYWSRSENAIAETMTKYGKYCYTIAYNILANNEDANEIVNDTYMGAWNSMPPHRPSVLSTFLGKITRCLSIDKWRARNTDKRRGGEIVLVIDELYDCIPDGNSVELEVETAELAKMINNFIKTIPLTEKRVFICRYWYLDSIPSICRQFGFTNSKVKSMLYRTRRKLLTYLKKEGAYLDSL